MTARPNEPQIADGTVSAKDASAPSVDIVETHRRVFLRRLRLDARIGAYEAELRSPQPIVIDVEIDVQTPDAPVDDETTDVLCYDRVHRGVRAILAAGHIRLVETLAERIAEMVLDHPLAVAVRVVVEKPSAVTAADGAGVEIRREKATAARL